MELPREESLCSTIATLYEVVMLFCVFSIHDRGSIMKHTILKSKRRKYSQYKCVSSDVTTFDENERMKIQFHCGELAINHSMYCYVIIVETHQNI